MVLAAVVVATVEIETTENDLHPWNEGSSCT